MKKRILPFILIGWTSALAQSDPSADVSESIEQLKTLEQRLGAIEAPRDLGYDSIENALKFSNPEFMRVLKELESQPERRRLVFAMGAAGIGKSLMFRTTLETESTPFNRIKLGSFRPSDVTVTQKDDLVSESGPEAHFGSLPVLTPKGTNRLLDVVVREAGAGADDVLLIDDLDEVHPDTSYRLLDEAMNMLQHDEIARPRRIVIFGRPEAFSDFLANPKRIPGDLYEVVELHHFRDYRNPAFADLVINSYFDYKRRTKPDGINRRVYDLLSEHPGLTLSLRILATANFLVEGIVSINTPHDVAQRLKKYIFSALLRRNKDTHDRPTVRTRAYVELFRAIARRYASRIDDDGFFLVNWDDTIQLSLPKSARGPGGAATFRVRDVLNRSGLAYLRPADFANPKFRFEPFWIHRYLLETPAALVGDLQRKQPPGPTPDRDGNGGDLLKNGQKRPTGEPSKRDARGGGESNQVQIGLGVFFLLVGFVVAMTKKDRDAFQAFLIAAMFALGVGFLSSLLVGAMEIEGMIKGVGIQAGAGFAIFVLILIMVPRKSGSDMRTVEPEGAGMESPPGDATPRQSSVEADPTKNEGGEQDTPDDGQQ